MIFPQRQVNQYQASLELKAMLIALAGIAICVAICALSVAQGHPATLHEHTLSWQLST